MIRRTCPRDRTPLGEMPAEKSYRGAKEVHKLTIARSLFGKIKV